MRGFHLYTLNFQQKISECSAYFTALQDINNLETQTSYKTTVNLRNLIFLKKKAIGGFLIIRSFV